MSVADLLAAIDGRIDLASVLWLLPLTFVFHDFEEILKVENWLRRRYFLASTSRTSQCWPSISCMSSRISAKR